jgi:hypothetical protein
VSPCLYVHGLVVVVVAGWGWGVGWGWVDWPLHVAWRVRGTLGNRSFKTRNPAIVAHDRVNLLSANPDSAAARFVKQQLEAMKRGVCVWLVFVLLLLLPHSRAWLPP